MRIGFVGFGEVTFHFINGFLSERETEICVYDTDYGKALQQKELVSKSKFVSVVSDINDLLLKCNNVFIAVPGNVDEVVFDEIIRKSNGGKLFIDLCTALPDKKLAIAEKCEANGDKYVDVAVMGAVPSLRHNVPMLVSGLGGSEFCQLFESYQMDITEVGRYAGDASIIKLCRSVYMKGLAALLIETKNICDAYGVTDEVFRSLAKSMNADLFEVYSSRLISGTYTHCKRRKTEVESSLGLIKSQKQDGYMTEATVKVYDNIIKYMMSEGE